MIHVDWSNHAGTSAKRVSSSSSFSSSSFYSGRGTPLDRSRASNVHPVISYAKLHGYGIARRPRITDREQHGGHAVSVNCKTDLLSHLSGRASERERVHSRQSRQPRNPSLFLVLLLLHHQRPGHSRYHSFSILGARAPGPILVQSRPTCAGGSEGGERWGTTAQESGNLSPGELPHRLCATNCDENLLQK